MGKKLKTYTIHATLDLLVGTEIKAESLSEAVDLAKELNVLDFVDIPSGEYIDGSLKITGAFE